MSWPVMQKSLDLALASPGKNKKISFYGGEPLLAWEQLVLAINYIKEQEKLAGGEIKILIISNGTLLDQAKLEYLKANKVLFVLSIDGSEASFAKNRLGYFQQVEIAAKQLIETFEPANLCAQIVSCPNTVADLAADWQYLVELGFTNINIDPVQGISWDNEAINLFESNLAQILKSVADNLQRGKDIFLNNVSRQIGAKFKKFKDCPFYSKLYVSTLGEMYFCAILMEQGKQFSIGNVLEAEIKAPYDKCQYDQASFVCQSCLSNYCRDFCHYCNFLKQTSHQPSKDVFRVLDQELHHFMTSLLLQKNKTVLNYLKLSLDNIF